MAQFRNVGNLGTDRRGLFRAEGPVTALDEVLVGLDSKKDATGHTRDKEQAMTDISPGAWPFTDPVGPSQSLTQL